MKIREISIRAYGPIKDFTLNPETFECIFGLNESGKTAIVEVLSYILFRKSSAGLRYKKPTNIDIRLEEDGIAYKLPAKKKQLELAPTDIARLLYVEASESSVYPSNKKEKFWDALKAMFSNIEKGITFKKLGDKIFEVAELQPVRNEWEKNKQGRIRTKEKRWSELKQYISKIGETEKMESELAQLNEKHELLKKELKTIEDYRNYRNYKDLSRLYNEYCAAKIHLKEFERYKEEYFDKWQKLETVKETRVEDAAHLMKLKREIAELGQEVMELNRKENIIEQEELRACVAKAEQEIREPQLVYPLVILCAATILLILSLFTAIPNALAFIIFGISLILLILTLYKKRIARKMLMSKDVWLEKAKGVFPDISNLTELAQKIETIKRTKYEKVAQLDAKREQIDDLSKKTTTEIIEKEITEFRNKTGLAELSDLKEKSDEKREIKKQLSELSGKIAGRLAEKDEGKWERLIKSKKTKPPEKEPDLAFENDMKEKLNKLTEKRNALRHEIDIFKGVQQTKFNIVDDYSVFKEYDKLQRELEDYELEKKAAITARDILRDMSSELDQYIEHITKGSESLSEYFELVTDRYTNVEVRDKDFYVQQEDGKTFSITELSTGAQDQLLLCLRLATLRKIYPKGTFLILDDAFIFADWQRRQKLVELLKNFINDGNQVLYFTSDNHTRDILEKAEARVTTI